MAFVASLSAFMNASGESVGNADTVPIHHFPALPQQARQPMANVGSSASTF
jgi:hypothetical protein